MSRRPDAVPTNLQAFGQVLYPEEAVPPILSAAVQAALDEWLEEIWAKDALKEVGLTPRHRALFSGPPGGGKTTLAHHLAARLGLGMVAVRPDRIIDAYIGSTGRNIGALFDLCQNAAEPVVLFLDEFDAYGLKRRAANQGAEDERNNSVNTLLQRIEDFSGYLIAATNRAKELDEAIWRRFDLQIAIEMPGQREREQILTRYLSPFLIPAHELTELARSFAEASPALIRQFSEGLKRNLIIGPRVGWDMGKEALVRRVLAAVAPHPDLTRPRLWSRGSEDPAIERLTWPLVNPKAAMLPRKRIRRVA